METAWTQHGKVRAREAAGVLEVEVDGLTTQAKYYKPLVYEFFRKVWRGSRPAWGEFSVEIRMDYVGDPPWLDLDNLAKAVLDAIKGYAFHDDAQVARPWDRSHRPPHGCSCASAVAATWLYAFPTITVDESNTTGLLTAAESY